jgi:hypothetical protein
MFLERADSIRNVKIEAVMIPKEGYLRGNAVYPQAFPPGLASPKAVSAPSSNVLQRVGYWFLTVYLLVVLSRVLDVTFLTICISPRSYMRA